MSIQKKTVVILLLLGVFSYASEDKKGVQLIKEIEGNEGKRWAICIGINNYNDEIILDLKYARNDAKELGKVLQAYGQFDRVYVMTDDLEPMAPDYPILNNIKKKMDFLKYHIKPEDLVVVAFSGHGVANGKNESFLVVLDSYPGGLFESSLKIKRIVDWLNELKVRKSLLLVDACREIFQVSKVVNLRRLDVPQFDGAEVAAAFYATGKAGFSYEDRQSKFGVFTRYLIDGLKGKADVSGNNDGIVTLSELEYYVVKGVYDWALAEEKNQKPYIKIYEEKYGDLALSTYSKTVNIQIRVFPWAVLYINDDRVGEIPPQRIINVKEGTTVKIKLKKNGKEYSGEFYAESGHIHWNKKFSQFNVRIDIIESAESEK